MKLIHLIAVHPLEETTDSGMNQVQHSTWTVLARDAYEAFDSIRHNIVNVEGISTSAHKACEVWAKTIEPYCPMTITSPTTIVEREVSMYDHARWVSVQEPYTQIHKGETSLQQHFDGLLQVRIDKRISEQDMARDIANRFNSHFPSLELFKAL